VTVAARRPARAAPRAAEAAGVLVRPATAADLAACARLGARLSRLHHRMDPDRFFTAPRLEEGYRWWLGKERHDRRAVVLAAVRRGRGGREAVVGYAYGRVEPRDWTTLRERCGVGIDAMVEPAWRGRGVGAALVEALAAALAARGAPRLVIQVASANPAAQGAFRTMGFRPTMVELTRELRPAAPPRAAPGRRARGRPEAASPAGGRPPRRR
jgi:ribosomal protein S18 acetylase RimI-like enzyme